MYEILSVTDQQRDVSLQQLQMSAGFSNEMGLFLEVRGKKNVDFTDLPLRVELYFDQDNLIEQSLLRNHLR